MSVWGRVFAANYDRLMAATERAGLGAERQRVLADARGRVLEIGAGTGANLDLYPSTVSELVLAEPEAPMADRLGRRLAARGQTAQVVRAPAERLPFADASFDTAVCTLVLCTVDDQARALAELRRILRADGRLLFLEHVRAPEAHLARWQDRLDPLWRRFGHGCRCNRATLTALGEGGFRVDTVRHGRIPRAVPIVRPLIAGRAVPV